MALPEGLWRVEGSASNVFLVRDGEGLFLVDAGTPGDVDAVRGLVADAGFDLEDVTGVLLTHYDYDHVGALAALADDGLDCPVYAHDPDASVLAGESKPGLWPHKALLQRVVARFLDTPDLPVERVADGDSVGSFTAYHTPGHGPGHLAWVSEARGVAFLGDLVHEDDGSLAPSSRAMSYDTDAVHESVVNLDDRAPAFDVICVGHGDTVVGDARGALAELAAALR